MQLFGLNILYNTYIRPKEATKQKCLFFVLDHRNQNKKITTTKKLYQKKSMPRKPQKNKISYAREKEKHTNTNKTRQQLVEKRKQQL